MGLIFGGTIKKEANNGQDQWSSAGLWRVIGVSVMHLVFASLSGSLFKMSPGVSWCFFLAAALLFTLKPSRLLANFIREREQTCDSQHSGGSQHNSVLNRRAKGHLKRIKDLLKDGDHALSAQMKEVEEELIPLLLRQDQQLRSRFERVSRIKSETRADSEMEAVYQGLWDKILLIQERSDRCVQFLAKVETLLLGRDIGEEIPDHSAQFCELVEEIRRQGSASSEVNEILRQPQLVRAS